MSNDDIETVAEVSAMEDNLSLSFFYQYITLEEDAANLESAKKLRLQVKKALTKVQNDLNKILAKVK